MSNYLLALAFLASSCACLGVSLDGFKPENIPALKFFDATKLGGEYGRYDKIGFGKCPKVQPDTKFKLSDMYGTWYLTSHYDEKYLYGKNCRKLDITSGDENELELPCRVNMTWHYVDAVTEKYETGRDGSLFVTDESNQGDLVYKKMNGPTENFLISAYSDTFIVFHACEEFPEDSPVAYYQHNWINSRKPTLSAEDQSEIERIYASLGISMKPFVPVDHDNCDNMPQ